MAGQFRLGELANASIYGFDLVWVLVCLHFF
jgi:hypothetical protein